MGVMSSLDKEVLDGIRKQAESYVWCHTSLIPALRRRGQMYLCEFKASLIYIAIVLGWPAEVDGETLLLRTQHTLLEGQRNRAGTDLKLPSAA